MERSAGPMPDGLNLRRRKIKLMEALRELMLTKPNIRDLGRLTRRALSEASQGWRRQTVIWIQGMEQGTDASSGQAWMYILVHWLFCL